MSAHLLLIGGWTRFYSEAKAAGHRLSVITAADALSEQDKAMIDRHVDLDMADVTVPDVVERLHREDPFDHVVCMRELGLDNAALIVDRLGIAGNPLRPVELTRNKLTMRRHLDAAGFPGIPYVGGPDRRAVTEFGDTHGWPVMLKGTRGYGSAETTMVSGADDVDRAFDKIGHDDLIVETFVPGPEFSVETFSWDSAHTVLGITEKTTTGPPSFVETGHTMPARLSAEQEAELGELVENLLRSVGHVVGPAHTEVILSPTGPVVVEAHTRAGGGFICDLTEFVTGVNVFTELFRGLAGELPSVTPKKEGVASTQYLTFPAGTVTEISGLDEALQIPGVTRCVLDIEVGQVISEPTSSFDRHGYVVVRGGSREEITATVAAVTAALKIVVQP